MHASDLGDLRTVGRDRRSGDASITRRPWRLLTIGHSYAVGVNRRLADAIARLGEWDVTAVAPARYRGDFGWHELKREDDERCAVVPVKVRFSRPPQAMLYDRSLRELLRQRWDLIHCWEEPYVAATAQIAKWAAPHVPLVIATFQNISKRYPPPFNWIERQTLDRADGVVAFGHTALEVLVARGFAASRARVIPIGVDTSRFAPDEPARLEARQSLGWDETVPVVGFLGRFVPEKGLEMLMGALDRTALPWRALFVGSGPLEPAVRAWADRHTGRVAVVTTAAHPDVPRWLNAMDMLCAPSLTTRRWREQFGRMLIEAFSCGVPVVASGSGEIPHVVGEAGVIVDEGDQGAWQTAIERLLEDAARRHDLALRGRARAVSEFDWAVVARRHSDFFRELLEGARPLPERAA
jgi:glycosyltransferase involved in cell wall biosynthesis